MTWQLPFPFELLKCCKEYKVWKETSNIWQFPSVSTITHYYTKKDARDLQLGGPRVTAGHLPINLHLLVVFFPKIEDSLKVTLYCMLMLVHFKKPHIIKECGLLGDPSTIAKGTLAYAKLKTSTIYRNNRGHLPDNKLASLHLTRHCNSRDK